MEMARRRRKNTVFASLKEDFTKGKWHAAGEKKGFGIPKRGFYKGKWPAAGEKNRDIQLVFMSPDLEIYQIWSWNVFLDRIIGIITELFE